MRLHLEKIASSGASAKASRSGRPTHRVERLHHVVGRFDKYLMGQDNGEYEIQ